MVSINVIRPSKAKKFTGLEEWKAHHPIFQGAASWTMTQTVGTMVIWLNLQTIELLFSFEETYKIILYGSFAFGVFLAFIVTIVCICNK